MSQTLQPPRHTPTAGIAMSATDEVEVIATARSPAYLSRVGVHPPRIPARPCRYGPVQSLLELDAPPH